MNKYKIDQEIFWVKYLNNEPSLHSFCVYSIRQTKDGYRYYSGISGAGGIEESRCFASKKEGVDAACSMFKSWLDN